MESFQRELIEYSGINHCETGNIKNFNQINKEEIVCIPIQKPDMEQLVKVWGESYIVDYEIVKTPIGSSLEGQIVTGYKLLICADIKLKFQYVALECTQSLHTTHTTIPICAYVVLPQGVNSNARIVPNIFIEDIFSEAIDKRCIYNNITMMVNVDIC